MPVLLAVLAVSSPLSGQVLRVRLLDAGSDAPITGAFAILERPAITGSAARAAAALSDGSGWVQLRAPAPGRYRLRVERLGYATYLSEEFALEGQETRQVRIAAQAVVLPAIRAAGRRRCGGVSELAAEAAVLWDEVRKALAVNSWTVSERSVSFVVREYARQLDPKTRAILGETSTSQYVWTTGSPFVSLGAQDLAENGFIRLAEGGGYQYYGPDSEVILSEWFQERHCFRAVASHDDAALIGLAFEPGPGAPKYDIEGVLWLDRKSAALQSLEYHYAATPVPLEKGVAGGEVRFERLPSGRWIVRSWWIRAPVMARVRGTSVLRVAGLREAGRTVVSLQERGGGADR